MYGRQWIANRAPADDDHEHRAGSLLHNRINELVELSTSPKPRTVTIRASQRAPAHRSAQYSAHAVCHLLGDTHGCVGNIRPALRLLGP